MKIAKSLSGLLIISAATVAPSVSAQETVLQSIVSRLIESAVQVTVTELQSQASQTVASTAYHFSPAVSNLSDGKDTYIAKVKINDLSVEHTDSTANTIEE